IRAHSKRFATFKALNRYEIQLCAPRAAFPQPFRHFVVHLCRALGEFRPVSWRQSGRQSGLRAAAGLEAGSMILQPGHVVIVWRGINAAALGHRVKGWKGPSIAPAMDFGVAIGEGEPAREIMVKARKILSEGVRAWGTGTVAGHIDHKVAPVNNVFALIE